MLVGTLKLKKVGNKTRKMLNELEGCDYSDEKNVEKLQQVAGRLQVTGELMGMKD